MIKHELKIGQTIYDINDERWGEILLIGGEDKDRVLESEDTDVIITYKPEDSDGENETFAECAYPLVKGRWYRGAEICLEVNKDELNHDGEHDYDYYSPAANENLWEFETNTSGN